MQPHALPRAFIGLLLLGLAVAAHARELRSGSPESVGMSSERLERLSDTLQAYVDQGQLAGSVTLVEEGKLLLTDPVGKKFYLSSVKNDRLAAVYSMNGGELDGRRILSRKSVELMTTSHLGDIAFNPGQGFGLGFYQAIVD